MYIAAERCFRVIHDMCEEASRSDLGGTCTEAFKLLMEARVAVDISRLGVLNSRTEVEKKTAVLHAQLTMAASLCQGTNALMREAEGLKKDGEEVAIEQAVVDKLDATLTDVEAVVMSKARDLGVDLGVVQAREDHELAVARAATQTARTIIKCYEEMGRFEDTRAIAGLQERLIKYTVRWQDTSHFVFVFVFVPRTGVYTGISQMPVFIE